MIEQDDELKDLFRRKNLEDAFPADEDNWKKMSAVLKSEQQDRRRLFIYLSLVLMLGLGGTWLFTETSEKNASSVALNEKQTTPVTAQTEAPVPSKTAATKKYTGEEKTENLADQTKIKKAEIKKLETPDPKNETAKEPLQHLQEAPLQDPGKTDLRFTKKTPIHQEPLETLSTQANVAISMKKVPKTADLDKQQVPEAAKNSQKTEPEPLNTAVATEIVKTIPGEDKTNTGLADQERPIENAQKQPEEEIKAVSHPELATLIPADSSASLPLAKQTNTLNEPKRDSVSTPVTAVKDSLPTNALPSQRIFLEAGANYLLGWKTNNTTEAAGLNPLLGIQYYHDVSKKIGLSVGILYSSINHLSATSHTSTTTRIKFGEETDVTVISALNMHYLLMPLKLNYSLSRNDFIGLGYTLAYLLDAQSKVETYSTGLNYSSTPVVSRSMGYTKGLNPFDGQLTVCYRRRVYKELYLNGEFFYGLRDIKNNVIYNTREFERAYGFRLSLGINLWKK